MVDVPNNTPRMVFQQQRAVLITTTSAADPNPDKTTTLLLRKGGNSPSSPLILAPMPTTTQHQQVVTVKQPQLMVQQQQQNNEALTAHLLQKLVPEPQQQPQQHQPSPLLKQPVLHLIPTTNNTSNTNSPQQFLVVQQQHQQQRQPAPSEVEQPAKDAFFRRRADTAPAKPTKGTTVIQDVEETPLDLSVKIPRTNSCSSSCSVGSSRSGHSSGGSSTCSGADYHAAPSTPLPTPLNLSYKNLSISTPPASTSSQTALASTTVEDERKQKRKEQNKAAALVYRQRKKSFSEYIETEHDCLSRKNRELTVHKERLEEQIGKMRRLLDDMVAESKRKQEEQREVQHQLQQQQSEQPLMEIDEEDHLEVKKESSVSLGYVDSDSNMEDGQNSNSSNSSSFNGLPPRSASFGSGTNYSRPNFQLKAGTNPADVPVGRVRKYSLPSMPTKDGASSSLNPLPTLPENRTHRKKEQNRLASQRFRQRRKVEQCKWELEARALENKNRRLRTKCDEMESKIKLLKDLMSRTENAAMRAAAMTAGMETATTSLMPPPMAPAPVLHHQPSTVQGFVQDDEEKRLVIQD